MVYQKTWPNNNPHRVLKGGRINWSSGGSMSWTHERAGIEGRSNGQFKNKKKKASVPMLLQS